MTDETALDACSVITPAAWGEDLAAPDIAATLIAELDEFRDLRVGEIDILFLSRAQGKSKGGKTVLGEMCLPRFQGSLGWIGMWLLARLRDGKLPDFIMVLDGVFWSLATPKQREALVYHELCHVEHARDKDGELRFTDAGFPVWALKAHDLEEFGAVVARYGAWLDDIQVFAGSLRRGGVIN